VCPTGTALSHRAPNVAHDYVATTLLSNGQFSASCGDLPLPPRDVTLRCITGLLRANFRMTGVVVQVTHVGQNCGAEGQLAPALEIAEGCQAAGTADRMRPRRMSPVGLAVSKLDWLLWVAMESSP